MIENLKIKEVKIAIFLSLIFKFFFLSLIYFYDFPTLISDQIKYWHLSERIYSNGEFFNENFSSVRVPIYVVFLAVLKKILNSVYFVISIQILLSLYTLYLIFLIGKFFSLNIAKISILLGALSLNLFNSTIFILTESIYLIFFLLFVYFFLKIENLNKEKINKYLILSAIFLGLSTLTRPIAFYFLPITLFLLFKIGLKNRIKKIFIFAIVFGIVLSPWCLRNYQIFGYYKLTSSAGPNLAGYYLPYVKSKAEGISTKEARLKNYEELQEQIDYNQNPFVISEFEKDFFFYKIDDYPIIFLFQAWLEGNLKLIFSPPAIDTFYLLDIEKTNFSEINEKSFFNKIYIYLFKNENNTYSLVLISSIFIIFIFRLLSLYSIFACKKKDLYKLIFFLALIGINLILTGPIGSARYRIIVEPFLIILSSISINHFLFKYFNK
tara:strand:- start:15653 stop:16966 length:1314 start_codon:yes stop_codon:yes gene_type:complete